MPLRLGVAFAPPRAERSAQSQMLRVTIQIFKTFIVEIIFHPLIRSNADSAKQISKEKSIKYSNKIQTPTSEHVQIILHQQIFADFNKKVNSCIGQFLDINFERAITEAGNFIPFTLNSPPPLTLQSYR
jgi:hypothetical protein